MLPVAGVWAGVLGVAIEASERAKSTRANDIKGGFVLMGAGGGGVVVGGERVYCRSVLSAMPGMSARTSRPRRRGVQRHRAPHIQYSTTAGSRAAAGGA